jgi:hypothetical protein
MSTYPFGVKGVKQETNQDQIRGGVEGYVNWTGRTAIAIYYYALGHVGRPLTKD